MSLPELSVRRPVSTAMVALVALLLGTVSMQRIQVDLLPEIELPTLSVRTTYEGASPEVMERLVTQIVEEIVATVPGVIELSSESAQGSSSVRVTFGWGTDVDTAALDVRSRIEDEIDELPEEIERPQVRKFDINSFPVVLLGISSTMTPLELTDLVENQLRNRFARISDVAQVDVWGGYERQMRVELNPSRLQGLGIPLDAIATAIRNANVDLPAGELDGDRLEVVLRAPAELKSLDELRELVVAVRDGGAVRLGDIARVVETYARLDRRIRVNGEAGLRLAIRKQADANTVEVSQAILNEVEKIGSDYPQLTIVPIRSQGSFIETSIDNVARSVVYGGFLALLVLLFFLLEPRSVLVIGVSIPVSIISTFAMMYFARLTINLTTLGGLALGVGMMVDSSIVVLENTFRRHDELKEDFRQAAVRGAVEVGPAILASTITTTVVFLPLGFVRGVSGLLFRDLAYVVVFALLCSLVVSLTLLPMLGAKIFSGGEHRIPPAWAAGAVRWAEGLTARLDRFYLGRLERALGHPWRTAGLALAFFVLGVALIPQIGTELLPPSDEAEVRASAELELGTKLDIVDRMTARLETLVLDAAPEAIAWVATAGASGRNPEDSRRGEVQLALTPSTDRARSSAEVAAAVREALERQIPGATIRVRAPQGSFILQRLLRTEDGLTVEVRGFGLDTLAALAERAAEKMRAVAGITDVELEEQGGVPQISLALDRAKIADLGLEVRQVAQTLETAVAGRQAGELRKGAYAYPIFLQLADVRDLSIEDVLDLTLETRSGSQVALRNLLVTSEDLGPAIIQRKDQQRLVSIGTNVAGRDLGSVAAEVRQALDAIPVPEGYELRLAGAFEEQQAAFSELLVSLGLAVLLVYMVLAAQYESFRNPLVVMLSVPMSVVGVVAILLLSGTTLNLQSYIGCIMLGGIVVNNAILLVDQASSLHAEGTTPERAAYEAGRRRLRPILMTTATTVLGLVPLALGLGEGADQQAPLARAVIGGLLGSTPVTLLLVPAAYLLAHGGSKRP